MKSAILDIETTELHGVGGGLILCACFLPDHGPVKTLKFTGHSKQAQRDLLRKLQAEMARYDVLILHNASFDMNFIKTRCVVLGVPLMASPLVYDTMHGFKRSGLRTILNKAGKPTASLKQASDLFHLPSLKTTLSIEDSWAIVFDRDQRALRDLVAHCEADVTLTAGLFKRLLREHLDPKPCFKRMW